ncbi:DoxX family protein [Gordonia sp. ABSL1-1]|uniref:DoxX family protein n=1 Tax=Gordonia sp. ABSL1-1 TaxID=3053923 RepID=UPI0025730CF6|nr:DoxX family protein [Gordonia sp. ABSL1-1]MDL9937492.1 DoxX family protein [Gordonia sp. ABSL1-1]
MAGFNHLAQFVARAILGVIFIAHGWQKLTDTGVDNVATWFKSLDIPLPTFSAYLATWAELIGGVCLIIGLLLPLVSLVLIVDMIGAIYYVHGDHGFWATDGGYEWPLALIAGLLAVGFVPHGISAADTYILKRRNRDTAAPTP